jgi:hypothetical protein
MTFICNLLSQTLTFNPITTEFGATLPSPFEILLDAGTLNKFTVNFEPFLESNSAECFILSYNLKNSTGGAYTTLNAPIFKPATRGYSIVIPTD